MNTNSILQQFIDKHTNLSYLEEPITKAVDIIAGTIEMGGKLLICGNGGSSSDADHIVGEFMKSFEMKRPVNMSLQEKLRELSHERGRMLAECLQQGLPAISLSAHTSLMTAIANDINSDVVFAQQVAGYGKKGDVLLALSTSGNSQNVIDALIVAKAKRLITIGMTGETGGKMKGFCDVLINVPEKRTVSVQELHLPVYHCICRMVEATLFNS